MLEVWPVPVLSDNYAWVLGRTGEAQVVVVDPGEAPPVEAALRKRELELVAVLLTHHHADHVSGVAALARDRLPVYGPALEHVAAVNHPLDGGDILEIAGLHLEVMHVPGHTRGHLAYVGPGLVACGDTLFAGGCGRLFEGTAAEMWGSLTRLSALPPETRVCCGHEYTVANLRFALRVEPSNEVVERRLAHAFALRERNRPTVPSTLAEELLTNPFLRADQPPVVEAACRRAGQVVAPGEDTFAVIRRWKDRA